MADIKLTKTDSTLGTIAYMSPEQVRSEEVDQQADIWSLGVILYEMLSGQLPFSGDREHALMYSILNREPQPLAQLCPELPSFLLHIVYCTLEKEAEARYQSLQEMLDDLRQLKNSRESDLTSLTETTKGIRRKSRTRIKSKGKKLRWKQASVIAFLAALGLLLIYWFLSDKIMDRGKSPPLPATHRQLTFTGKASIAAISPDGKSIAYANNEDSEHKVLVQDIRGGQSIMVFSGKTNIGTIKWSPDGSELFSYTRISESYAGGILIPRLGGSIRQLNNTSLWSCWAPNGDQIAGLVQWSVGGTKIHFIQKTTGDSIADITLVDSVSFFYSIDWSPLGDNLLCLSEDPKGYAIWLISTDGNQQQKIVEDSLKLFSPRWSKNGEAIYYLRTNESAKDLMKINLSSANGRPESMPRVLQTGIQASDFFTLSEDNKRLLYTRELPVSNLWSVHIGSRDIQTKKLTTGTAWYHNPRISPDGSRIAFSIGRPPQANIFVMPTDGGKMQQLTFLDGYNTGVSWSPDGENLVFGSIQQKRAKIWRINIHGGIPHPFENSDLNKEFTDITWAPGNEILYERPGHQNIHFINPRNGNERPLVENDSVGWIFTPRYSPDGKKVAVFWNRTPFKGLWMMNLEDSSQVPLHEGRLIPIQWSSDGNWVYASTFRKSPTEILMIPTNGGESKILCTLPAEFDTDIIHNTLTMTSDGKYIVVPVIETQSDVWLMENFDPEAE